MGCRGSRPPPGPPPGPPPPEPQALPEVRDEEPRSYAVGKRYQVARPLDLWSSENLDGTRYRSLTPNKDVVLLVGFGQSGGSPVGTGVPVHDMPVTGLLRGYVIPTPAEGEHAGWISLEDIQSEGSMQPALSKVEMPGSWVLKSRYSLQHPATLQVGPFLDSALVGQLDAGDEVLLLDLAVTSGTASSSQAHLRALVVAGNLLGWISPESGTGEHLLTEVNLMSRTVAGIQQTLQQNSASLRKSYHPGRSSPWKEGATYRILEASEMRSGPAVHGSKVGQVSAGSLVQLRELKNVIIDWGWCPVAFILVQDGPEKGLSGWVHCAAKDGHDVVDTRDYSEYYNVLQKMRGSAEAFAEFASDARPKEVQAVNSKRADSELKRMPSSPGLKEPTSERMEKTFSTGSQRSHLRSQEFIEMESPAAWRNERMAAEFSALSETLQKLDELEQQELRWMLLGNVRKVQKINQKALPRESLIEGGPVKGFPSEKDNEWSWCSCGSEAG